MKEKITIKDIKSIVNDKEIINNLDYTLLKNNKINSTLSVSILFLEPIIIFFGFFVDITKPVGDYAFLKIISFGLFIFSAFIIDGLLDKFFNKNYYGLTLNLITKIFYRFSKEEKNILNQIIDMKGFYTLYTPKTLRKILNYYNSLNEKEKKYFLKKTKYKNILEKNIINYIESNDVETIKRDKEELTNIVINNFNNYDIDYISIILKNKLKKDKEIQKKMFLDNFEDDEPLEIKINKNKQNIIKEI